MKINNTYKKPYFNILYQFFSNLIFLSKRRLTMPKHGMFDIVGCEISDFREKLS